MDAVLFLITGIRYFWGPPIDLTRLTLFLVAGWAVIGDMDLYYNWPIMLPAISYSDRGLIAKYLLAVGVAVDILKDWWKVRQMGFFRDIHRMSKET